MNEAQLDRAINLAIKRTAVSLIRCTQAFAAAGMAIQFRPYRHALAALLDSFDAALGMARNDRLAGSIIGRQAALSAFVAVREQAGELQPMLDAHGRDAANLVRVYEYAIAWTLLEQPLDADWLATQDYLEDLSTGRRWSKDELPWPLLSSWYGADRWSTAAKNRQPVPGKKPGQTLLVAPGSYDRFRITLTGDVDPNTLPADRVTSDGQPLYGLRNDWKIAQSYTVFGRDEITAIKAEVKREAVVRGPVYHEWGTACRLEGLKIIGPCPATYLLGTENPKASQGEWQQFRDLQYVDLELDGRYDWSKPRSEQNDRLTKWGWFWYRLGLSARGDFGAILRGAWIHDIWEEHGIYGHTVDAGAPDALGLLIEDCLIERTGRCSLQLVARETESGNGQGKIVVRRCQFVDACLGDGGSAITLAGNHDGDVLLDQVTVRLGSSPQIHPSYADHVTGAFVSHAGDGGGDRPTRQIEVRDCDWEIGPRTGTGSHRRPNLNIGAVGTFILRGGRHKVWPGGRECLAFHPDSIGTVVLDEQAEVIGDCVWSAEKFADPGRDGSGYRKLLAWLGSSVAEAGSRVEITTYHQA